VIERSWGFKSLRPHFLGLEFRRPDAHRLRANPIKERLLSAVRRRSKFLVLFVAVAGSALALSACAFFKANSLSVSQPAGLGAARVHFVLCTNPDPEAGTCSPEEDEEELQYLLGLAVPPGSSAPATITASPSAGGPTIVFTRNDQVAPEIAAATAFAREKNAELDAWPPAGLEGVGYLSNAIKEVKGLAVEWTVDADFGLPVSSDGGPFASPFKVAPAYGFRGVDAEKSPNRSVHCVRFEGGEPDPSDAVCGPVGEEAEVATSDLKIASPPTTAVFVGGKASVPYGFNFGSTASTLPSFNVTATSTLPGAAVTVSAPSFTPPATDATTHRSTGSETVTVAVPKNAKPGVYDVTIMATRSQGGTATQVAKVEVTKPKLKLGKVKLNKANGTAKLSIGVPSAGTLTASGKGVAKAQRKAKAPKTVKVTIKAKGKAKAKLAATGKAKVKAKIVFKPENGAPVTKTKSITLKKKLT
jgi:hypothetical protein